MFLCCIFVAYLQHKSIMESNNFKSQLSTKSLEKLRDELPKGSYSVISERFKISKSTVSRVLSGKMENIDVIEYAIYLAERKRNKIDALSNKIDAL